MVFNPVWLYVNTGHKNPACATNFSHATFVGNVLNPLLFRNYCIYLLHLYVFLSAHCNLWMHCSLNVKCDQVPNIWWNYLYDLYPLFYDCVILNGTVEQTLLSRSSICIFCLAFTITVPSAPNVIIFIGIFKTSIPFRRLNEQNNFILHWSLWTPVPHAYQCDLLLMWHV